MVLSNRVGVGGIGYSQSPVRGVIVVEHTLLLYSGGGVLRYICHGRGIANKEKLLYP